MRARGWLVSTALVATSACKGAPQQVGPAGSASAPASPSTPAPASASASASASAPAPASASAPASAAGSAAAAIPGDAGAHGCRVLRGPIELPYRSPAALAVRGESLEVLLNDDGRPRTVSLTTGSIPPASVPAPAREPADGGVATGYAVGCVFAGDRVYCPDRTGAVHRTARDGSGDRVVASSRTGSRIGGALLGGTHSAVGYLASRQTTEGWVTEAWLAVDDEPPVRLSEDGSGATALLLAPRGREVVAVSVDARSALTALHVRPILFEGRAKLGEDVVVFVGGPGDRRTAAGFAAPATGPAWALLPIAKDIGTFGLAIVRVDEPARVDEPVVWSMYPNGIDPAPVAAAVEGGRTWVARVRPRTAEPSSARLLEVGTLGADAAFAPHDEVAVSGKPMDVSLAFDAHGAAWLAWVDGAGSWLERLACK